MPIGTGANFRRIARVRSTKQSVLCAKSKLNKNCRKYAQYGLRECKARSNPYYALKLSGRNGNEHKVPIGTLRMLCLFIGAILRFAAAKLEIAPEL